MGRMYKTSASSAVDFMYELPKEAMMKAVEMTDKKITNELTAADEAAGNLDLVKNLKGDNQFVNDRYNEYQSDIDNISSQIRKDPLAYKRLGGKMRDVSRKIQEDLTRGGLHKAQQQFDKFEDYKKQVNESTEFSDERKKLLIEASEKAYGNLSFEDQNTYNNIDPHLIAGSKEVDEEKLINTIGQGWTADKTSWSSARATEDGYIKSGRGTRETREADDAEAYIRDSMKSSGWHDDKRQMLELQQQTGRLSPDADIDEMMAIEEERLVNKGRQKLGYEQTTSVSGLTGDSTQGRGGVNDKNTPKVDVKVDDIGNPVTRKIYQEKNIQIDEAIENGDIEGYESADDIYNVALNRGVDASYRQLAKAGIFKVKKDYTDWLTLKDKANSQYQYVDNNPNADLSAKEVVAGFNKMTKNQKLGQISVRTSNNTLVPLDGISSLGDLTEKGTGSNVIYTPVTGKAGNPGYKKNPNGDFLDSKDRVIMAKKNRDDKNEKPVAIKSYEQAVEYGVVNSIQGAVEDMATYSTNKNLYKADPSNVFAKTSNVFNSDGSITTTTNYYYTANVTEFDTRTKKYTNNELVVEVPTSTFSK